MRALDDWWLGRASDWEGREAECQAFFDFFLLRSHPNLFSARDYRKKSLYWHDCQLVLSSAYEQMKAMMSNPFAGMKV